MLIVSLTSYRERLQYVPQVINSILKNTMLPDKICITLYKEDVQYITDELERLFRDDNVELFICNEDIRPHKKYFYTMKRYPDDVIITIDDDIIYPDNFIESLYKGYKAHPDCVSALRCHYITYDENGNIKPYNEWKYECKEYVGTPKYDLFATGCGGVLYPPNILKLTDDDLKSINECLYADDIWLHWKKLELGIKTVYIQNDSMHKILFNGISELNWIEGTQEMPTALNIQNRNNGRNDEYLKLFKFKHHDEKPIVIYTCITGGYEIPVDNFEHLEGYEYILFSDVPIETKCWTNKIVKFDDSASVSDVKKQRFVKLRADLFLKEYDVSVWIDANTPVDNKLYRYIDSAKSFPIVFKRHPERDCVYQELKANVDYKKEKKEICDEITQRYRSEGMPEHFGLFETNVVARHHKIPLITHMMSLWFTEISKHSHRDQLSLTYILWKNDLMKYISSITTKDFPPLIHHKPVKK